MNLSEIYRGRRTRLADRIKACKGLPETADAVEEAFETMKYQYLSRPENRGMEEAAEHIFRLATSSFPVIESVNKANLWESAGPDGKAVVKKKNPAFGLILLAAGIAMVLGSGFYFSLTNSIPFSEIQNLAIVMAAGCLVILASGFALFHRKKVKSKTMARPYADRDDLTSRLEKTVKAMDEALKAEKDRRQKEKKELEYSIDPREIQLFSYLLEAGASGDGRFALEQIEEVRRYLSGKDVVILDYSAGNEKYFDFLEGDKTATLRPALIRGGEVLARGLASMKKEENLRQKAE